jgi:hypothetical protein
MKPTFLAIVNDQNKVIFVDFDAFKQASYAKIEHHKKWINKLWNDRKNPWTNNIIRSTLTIIRHIQKRNTDPRLY